MGEVPQVLRESQVLEGLSPVQLQDVAALANRVAVPAGETIFARGDPGDSVFVVGSGTVRIVDEAEVLEHEVEVLAPGAAFGVRSLLTGEARSAAAIADSDCEVYRFDRRAWVELVESRHPTAATVLHNLALLLCNRMKR